ncbi:MAG: exodeoxyribonuclease VII large subunit [Gammaproteobacteria bacterium]
MSEDREIFSVSSLNSEAKKLIENRFGTVWVEGEISDLRRHPPTGHLYWTLKDPQSQIQCAMWESRNRALSFEPDNGQQVLVRARVSLYEPRGRFSLVVDHMEETGEGLLRHLFEELKKKLAKEGLFEESRKRSLPRLPRRIGVVTSPSGAAIRDVLTVLQRRFPAIPVLIYPTSVQGSTAAAEISATLELAGRRRDCDLLILARGGGSMADLWAFNEEIVARTIATLGIPIISGVGHEEDFTIADLAADLRAPTPSGAAELAVPDQLEWREKARIFEGQLTRTIRRAVGDTDEEIKVLAHRLNQAHPGIRLSHSAQWVDELEARLQRSLKQGLEKHQANLARLTTAVMNANPKHRLTSLKERYRWKKIELSTTIREILSAYSTKLIVAQRALNAVGPLHTLERGYAIVSRQDTGGIVRNAASVSPGTGIAVRLAQGTLGATVDDTQEEK